MWKKKKQISDSRESEIRKRKRENRKTAEKKANWKISGALAALLAAVAVFTVMLQMEKKVLTQYERGSVLTAIQEVPRGNLLTEENWQQYFAEKQIDKSVLPEKSVTTPLQIIGYRPVYDIASGTLLTENMFENFNIRLEQFKEPVIAGVKADDIYQVAGGILRAGDVIQIYSVQEGETVPVWQEIYVQQVFDASGKQIENADRTTAAQRMNLYLEQEDVARFYTELAAGSLRAVKLCNENTPR